MSRSILHGMVPESTDLVSGLNVRSFDAEALEDRLRARLESASNVPEDVFGDVIEATPVEVDAQGLESLLKTAKYDLAKATNKARHEIKVKLLNRLKVQLEGGMGRKGEMGRDGRMGMAGGAMAGRTGMGDSGKAGFGEGRMGGSGKAGSGDVNMAVNEKNGIEDRQGLDRKRGADERQGFDGKKGFRMHGADVDRQGDGSFSGGGLPNASAKDERRATEARVAELAKQRAADATKENKKKGELAERKTKTSAAASTKPAKRKAVVDTKKSMKIKNTDGAAAATASSTTASDALTCPMCFVSGFANTPRGLAALSRHAETCTGQPSGPLTKTGRPMRVAALNSAKIVECDVDSLPSVDESLAPVDDLEDAGAIDSLASDESDLSELIDDEDDADFDDEDAKNPKNANAAMQKDKRATPDDWNSDYCKRRLAMHRRRIRHWADAWNVAKTAQEPDDAAFAAGEAALEQYDASLLAVDSDDDDDDYEEEPVDEVMHVLDEDSNFQIPARLYHRLLAHQKFTLTWLFGHHRNSKGAVLGDEMGLGKTAQVISFLAALKSSNKLSSPTLVVAPATTLSQWVEEFNEWHPEFRVFVLHSSFKVMTGQGAALAPPRTGHEVVDRAFVEREADIILSTYEGLNGFSESLLSPPWPWGYVVLDEAHRIRNPDTKTTLACKRLNTSRRLALTGAPIQNHLKELWSLFDFVVPMKLGTLPTFESSFVVPIRLGGMMNANPSQVYAAFEAAQALRGIVTPYMLRRLKKDVAKDLPKKTERVLFCNLSPAQTQAYKKCLQSPLVQDFFFNGKDRRRGAMSKDQASTGKAWKAIVRLRTICNHPDLLNIRDKDLDSDEERDELLYAGDDDDENDSVIVGKNIYDLDPSKSSKMQVLEKLLTRFRSENDKVLLFCQSLKMLSVLEVFARKHEWPFMRMDGMTPVQKRQPMISRFNTGDPQNTFLFLLTTKVGGVGVNLTGANRVMIFDPDWNPSTDAQARERAWRLGQKREVMVFRFILSGTIEEKIYHRQIFKEFISHKVLHDPSQRRFFKDNDFRDLFTYVDPTEEDEEEEERLGGGAAFSKKKSKPNSRSRKPAGSSGAASVSRVMYGGDAASLGAAASSSSGGGKTETSQMFYEKVVEVNDDDNNQGGGDGKDDDNEVDNTLLKSLFAPTDKSFREAFDHEIVENKAMAKKDILVAERRAKAMALTALKAYRDEQNASVNRVVVDLPTFTGRHGAPPVAAAIIAAARGMRSSLNESSAGAAAMGPAASLRGTEMASLTRLKTLVQLLKREGSMTSEELIAKFKPRGGNNNKEEDSAVLFRTFLNEVARKLLVGSEEKWVLKEEYGGGGGD